MQAPQVTFAWPVSEAGYRWEEDRLLDNRRYYEMDSRGVRYEIAEPIGTRAVYPMEQPTLARVFSDLPADDPGTLLAFANEWGMLTRGEVDFDSPGPFERMEVWTTLIAGFSRLFGLSDAIRRLHAKPGDHEYGNGTDAEAKRWLAERITWSPKGMAVTFEDDAGKLTLHRTDSYMYRELWHAWENAGKVGRSNIAAAQAFRMYVANDLLETHPLRALIPAPLEGIEPPPALYVPDSLRGALCLLAYQEITGTIGMRRCAGCGEWFAVGDGRKDRRFAPGHETRCSVRASRRGDTVRKRKGGETE